MIVPKSFPVETKLLNFFSNQDDCDIQYLLTMFVNLVNEDYYVSPVNGKRYEIKSKKLLEDAEGEPPRG